MAMSARGPYDELIKEFRSGYAFTFDVLMDIGGWRDMHRHRRCQQIQQNFTTVHGYEVPPPLVQAGLDQEYRQAMDAVRSDIEHAQENECGGVALRDAVWIQGAVPVQDGLCRSRVHRETSLRVKGHWSYRTVAWLMKQKLAARYPFLGDRIQGDLAGRGGHPHQIAITTDPDGRLPSTM